MKNKRFFGMIVYAALAIGLVLAGCDTGTGNNTEGGNNSGGGNSLTGTWSGGTGELTINDDGSWTLLSSADSEDGTYTIDGATATLKDTDGNSLGTAVLTNSDTLTITLDNNSPTPETYTFTRQSGGNKTGGGDNTGGGNKTGDGNNTGGGTTTTPSAPTGVTATALSASSISVSWSAASGADSYKVYYEIGSSTTKNLAGTATGVSYIHTGLEAGTTYYYYIKAVNSAGESDYSSFKSATTLSSSSGGNNTGGGSNTGGGDNTGGGGSVAKPNTPTGVKATAQSSSSISVSWNTVSGATSYKIYRGVSATWTPSETTASGTSYTFTGLDTNTTYYFRIAAVNSGGESAQSSAVPAKTQAAPLQKPNAPYGSPVVVSASQTSTSLKIQWNGSLNATGYKLYRASGDSSSFTVVYSGSATTYTDNGVTSGVTYKYKVTATNSAGESEDSDVLTYRKL